MSSADLQALAASGTDLTELIVTVDGSPATLSTQGDLGLVEARVHLAASQYHNSLANSKLVPRPPSAPRSRPASAGGARVQVPFQNSGHARGFAGQIRAARDTAASMESVSEALSVLMGPWGTCATDAPPGIITSALKDIAEFLNVSAAHRERRQRLSKARSPRANYITQPAASSERLHANIIGRSLGRSFANVLLLTKVLLAFREVARTSYVKNELDWKKRRHRAKVTSPDLRAVETSFQAWCHQLHLSRQRKEMEAEIMRGRHALVDVWAQGRSHLARAVQCLHGRLLRELLLACVNIWKEVLRIYSLERYDCHLCAMRDRNPRVVGHALLPGREALLLASFVTWAAWCAIARQGRLLEDSEKAFSEAMALASARSAQLMKTEACKVKLGLAGRGHLVRNLRSLRQMLSQLTFQAWHAVARKARAFRERLQRSRLQAACRSFVQAWHATTTVARRKARAMRRGMRSAQLAEAAVQSQALQAWQQALVSSKAKVRQEHLKSRQLRSAEHSLKRASYQSLRLVLAAWCEELDWQRERRLQKERALAIGRKQSDACDDFFTLRLFASWQSAACLLREERRQQAMAEEAWQHIGQERTQKFLATKLSLEKASETSDQAALEHCWQAWKFLRQRCTSSRRRKEVAMQVASRSAERKEEALMHTCFTRWAQNWQDATHAQAQAQAVKRARAEVHLKTTSVLRKKLAGDAEFLLLCHLSAWQKHVLEKRLRAVKKDKAMVQALGKVLHAEDRLRARCLTAWSLEFRDAREGRRAVQATREAKQARRSLSRACVSKHISLMDQASLEVCWSAWLDCRRQEYQRFHRLRASHAAAEHRAAEADEYLLHRCFCAWHLERSSEQALRDHRSAVLDSVEVTSERVLRGLWKVTTRFDLLTIVFTWREIAEKQKFCDLWLERHKNDRMKYLAKTVLDDSQNLVAVLFQSLASFARRERAKRQKLEAHDVQAERLLRAQEEALLLGCMGHWQTCAVEGRCHAEVANAYRQARGRTLRARDQKLAVFARGEDRLSQSLALTYLLRWAAESRASRATSCMKEQAMAHAACLIERRCEAMLGCCFAALLSEATSAKQERFMGEVRLEVRASSASRARVEASHKKALSVISRSQGQSLRKQFHLTLRWWRHHATSRRRRRLQARAFALRHGAISECWLAAYFLACWRVVTREEKAVTRCTRCMTIGRFLTVKLRCKLLMLKALQAWHSARCYEELFRILGDTKADLARAAEAAAIAESAAAVAAQRNQVTVRVLPPSQPKPSWPISHVPSAMTVFPTDADGRSLSPSPLKSAQISVEPVESSFQAPTLSLQKDIERHYGQLRAQDTSFRRPRPLSAGTRRPIHDASVMPRVFEVSHFDEGMPD
eukprot:TRINITY_DN36454_c0_g1_i1.p1 TRINITY_DN36454_c0_g1~~TRINITY_DN36454_c0_g1_i1.p1  ORF type:complete len:1367 (+),score=260.23 TRINITY_DN36454_c0_g1_i1:22-4122(+)